MRKNKYVDEQKKIDARVDWMIKNGVNYFQPTICPAPKNVEKREIESLEEAMKYYAPYTDKVILQTKFMGSYCAIYLRKNHEESTFFSRNGYKINHIEGLHEASKELHKKVFESLPKATTVIVESELMPWRVMGSGLIDMEYGNYGHVHKTHLDHMKTSTIYDKINKLRETSPWERENLKQHEVRQYNGVRDVNLIPFDEYQENLDLFLKQLDIFGKVGEVEFKPFNILKIEGFEDLNDDTTFMVKEDMVFPKKHIFMGDEEDYIVVDVNDYERAYAFLNDKRDLEHEGIMVKPYEQQLINLAPCMKVRTNNYLQLIYGINFNREFQYYLDKRNIRHKLRQSIADYELAVEMLRTPSNNLKRSKRLYYKAIDGEMYTKTLDTRL